MAFIIQSSPPWLHSESTLRPSTNRVRAAVAPDHILMLRKDRSNNVTSIQWHFNVVHQQNKDDCVGLAQIHPTSTIPRSVLSHW